MLIRVIYVSTAVGPQTSTMTNSILKTAQAWNHANDVTDVLCRGQGVFLQVLEGERSVVTKLYSRIYTLLLSACTMLAGLALPIASHAIEEPAYTVERQLEAIEVRTYAPYTVAEVIVDANADDAGSLAFPILAGYIFGKNKGERKLAMTAPVIQSAVPVKMEMTAPVTQAAVSGGFLVQFVLPLGVTVNNAPEPLDLRIKLREMPEKKVAVIQYSGFWSESNYSEHLTKLQLAMKGAGLEWVGEPVFSRYNPPFTPWFMRRNEIWLQIAEAP